ncbi:cytochrome c oxidase assembly protein [Bacillus sp. FJAT-52991]|uniref:Cytochrome c oxidase assembly protein n=1 Tax=Bacillus kandeliae TaxID=3129297 RepID=A0ABZ2N218_9BACI
MSDNLISHYGWFKFWGVGIFVMLVLLSLLYMKLISKYKVTTKQKFFFFTAVVLVYLFKGSPIAVVSADQLFSAHVLQLMVILFIVPPLCVMSLPVDFLRSYFWSYQKRRVMKWLTHPFPSALLFNMSLSVYFAPPVFNVISDHSLLTFVGQGILLLFAFIMWWTIITPLPEMTKLSEPVRVLYIFLASLLLLPVGIFLLASGNPHYTLYQEGQQILPSLSALGDQQLGGGFLKGIQLTTYGIALFVIMSKWAKKEEEPDDDYPYYARETFNMPYKKK